MGTVQRLRPAAAGVTLDAASRAFLANYTAAQTIRAYALVLDRLAAWAGPDADLAAAAADPDAVAEWFRGQWSGCAPATWNARLAALRSAGSYWIEQGWIHANPAVRLKDESLGEDLDRALSEEDVDALIADTVQPLRDRALWSLLYESVARSEEVLSLDIPDLDIRAHRAKVRRKGGARDAIVYQSRSACCSPGSSPAGRPDRCSSPTGAPAPRSPGSTSTPSPAAPACPTGGPPSSSRPTP